MGAWSPWDDNPTYYWVVICKNKSFHNHTNTLFGHKIPLGETDKFAPVPVPDGSFEVVCDECDKTNSYKAKDILRVELDAPEGFTPHPLFTNAREANIGPQAASSSSRAVFRFLRWFRQ